MIEVPAAFVAWIRQSDGETGEAWLTSLPGRFADLVERWDLTIDGTSRHGGMSLVLPVRRGDELLMLKIARLNDATVDEAAALAWWDGGGTVRLVEAVPSEGVLLLERLDPDRTLVAVGKDEAATVIGDLIRLLAIPVGSTMRTFTDEIAGIISGIESRWLAQGRPFDRATLERALAVAGSLPTGADLAMVNRDLWDGNILAASRRPWLVIDPQPIAGPLEYAVSPSLLRRIDQMTTAGGADRFIRRVCEAGRLDRDLVIACTVIRIADYWLWALANGLTEDPRRCRRLLEWLI